MPKLDMNGVIDTAICLLYLDPEPNPVFPLILSHPFFESRIVFDNDGKQYDIIENEEKLKEIRSLLEKQLRSASDAYDILALMRKQYYLAFLRFAKPYLDKHTFDELLAYMWVNSENPNQDVNVPISTFISWFKAANRKTIMDKQEYDYYMSLPDEVNVYRGVAVGRAESDGLSWTCNKSTAEWFAHRFDSDEQRGYVLKGTIKKADIFAYLNSRNEDEILCNAKKVYDLERV